MSDVGRRHFLKMMGIGLGTVALGNVSDLIPKGFPVTETAVVTKPLTYGELHAVTQKYFIPKLVDNIFDSNPLFKRMKERGLDGDEGTRIVQKL
jgi:hypothetical protein